MFVVGMLLMATGFSFKVAISQFHAAALQLQLFQHVVHGRLVKLHAEHAVAGSLGPRRLGRNLVGASSLSRRV